MTIPARRFQRVVCVALTMGLLTFAAAPLCRAQRISPGSPPALGASLPNVRLSTWQRGLSVDSTAHAEMRVYVWFYEWQLFDAVQRGQMTGGVWTGRDVVRGDPARGKVKLPITVSDDRLTGSVVAAEQGLRLDFKAVTDGAEMTLRVTNLSDHDWPKLAAVIPCFNPGPEETRNRQFANTKTHFYSADGLSPLAVKTPREMHFNGQLRAAVDAEADDQGRYSWTFKWPKSDVDAAGGLIVRESTDPGWVTGIAWERFLSVQGHNPWECMHLSINVGPLAQRQSRTVRGKIYLFAGTKEELLDRYRSDFRVR